jgi:hypothetical protein
MLIRNKLFSIISSLLTGYSYIKRMAAYRYECLGLGRLSTVKSSLFLTGRGGLLWRGPEGTTTRTTETERIPAHRMPFEAVLRIQIHIILGAGSGSGYGSASKWKSGSGPGSTSKGKTGSRSGSALT